MDQHGDAPARNKSRIKWLAETVRRAFAEFLRLPTLILGGFLALAACTTAVDSAAHGPLSGINTFLRELFFRDGDSLSTLLATIAGSIITVTSITFSLLLLAVQQAAGALTHQVYDQFLRRRVNQVYFGCFVGLAVYTLVILATVSPPYLPILGATLALVLSIVALMLLIVLLYTTINQMRPVVIIESIHDRILIAREPQIRWIRRTRRATRFTPADGAVHAVPVLAREHGYVTWIDVEALGAVAGAAPGEAEILLAVSIGSFVAFGDTLAMIRDLSPPDTDTLAPAVGAAIRIEQQRDLDTDPADGIEQLAIMGWTCVSTAKSNPSPGLMVVRALRDLLARWSAEEDQAQQRGDDAECLPVVYTDNVFTELIDAVETLAVVASESMQPQTMAEIARTLAVMFARLPQAQRPRVDGLIRNILSALGDHVLTTDLQAALIELENALNSAGSRDTAADLRAARLALSASVGRLGSRSTRAAHPG